MPQLQLPREFGRYRLEQVLGRGGMGTVYLAQDSVLKRQVALKIPHFDHTTQPQVIKRFYREARIAANIHHSNICPIFDVGQIEGLHYLTMPFLQGTPLSHYIHPQHPWKVTQAIGLVRKLARALSVLHSHDVIHRDLKPGNILIQPNNEPILMDFGLARHLGESSQQMTAPGQPMGTPVYMAPEQVMGTHEQMGAATDVYALGVLLFELLTGHVPFQGQVFEVYHQILNTTPPQLSRCRPDITLEIENICRRCLAKEPQQRYPNMPGLVAALDAATQQHLDIPATSSPDVSPPLSATPSRAHPASSAAVPVAWQSASPPTDWLPNQNVAPPTSPGGGSGGTPQTATPAPGAGRRTAHSHFPCPGCGGMLWLPAPSAAWNCPRCGYHHQQELPQLHHRTPGPENAPTERINLDSPGGSRNHQEPPDRSRKRWVWWLVGLLLLFLGGGVASFALWKAQILPEPPAEPALTLSVDSPLSVIAGTDATVQVNVHREQCTGPVELRLHSLPSGITAPPLVINADDDHIHLDLKVDATVPPSRYPLQLQASIHETQARKSLVLNVLPRVKPQLTIAPLAAVTLQPGQEQPVRVQVQRQNVPGKVTLHFQDLPRGVSARPACIPADSNQGSVMVIAASSAEPGISTVQLRAVTEEIQTGITLALRVVNSERKLTLLPLPSVKIQAGKKQTLSIRVQRQHCPDEVTLRFDGLPAGVHPGRATIRAGSDETTVTFTASTTTVPGTQTITVQASAGKTHAKGQLVLRVLPADPKLTVLAVDDVSLQAGTPTRMRVRVRRHHCPGVVKVQLEGLPEGVDALVEPIGADESQTTITLLRRLQVGKERATVRIRVQVGSVSDRTTFTLVLAPLPRSITNSVGMKLVLVPAGTFTMGSPKTEHKEALKWIPHKYLAAGGDKRWKAWLDAEGPQHKVEISQPFYLGVYEVTQEQFRQVMDYNPSFHCVDPKGNPRAKYFKFSQPGGGKEKVKGLNTRRFPVENVSWEEAVAFSKKLSQLPAEKRAGRVYRLPTEAEWEYAYREAGKANGTFYSGNTLTSHLANFDGSVPFGTKTKGPSLKRPAVVGSYKPNRLGLYDLQGNVFEWCLDQYDEHYYGRSRATDPECATSGDKRVTRGGSYWNFGYHCRAAMREKEQQDACTNLVGFRILLQLQPGKRKKPQYVGKSERIHFLREERTPGW